VNDSQDCATEVFSAKFSNPPETGSEEITALLLWIKTAHQRLQRVD